MTECPHCGQQMLVRFGERFPPRQAAILDMIENVTRGRGGIELESLIAVFYPGESRSKASQNVRSNIVKINDRLVSTDYRITGPGSGKTGFYRLTKDATA